MRNRLTDNMVTTDYIITMDTIVTTRATENNNYCKHFSRYGRF